MTGVVAAVGDCERIGAGLLGQPVNALSSLAYVVAGIALATAAHRPGDGHGTWPRTFASAVAANGLGGAAYHGLGGTGGTWLHDAALLATLGVMAARDVERLAGRVGWHRGAPGLAVAAGLLAASPRLGGPAQIAAAATVGVAELLRLGRRGPGATPRRPRDLGVLALILAPAGAVYLLSRTGAPLCRPDSLLQGHALWHALTATALWWWGRTEFRAR